MLLSAETVHPESPDEAPGTDPAAVHCPSCSAPVQASWLTCPDCGVPLEVDQRQAGSRSDRGDVQRHRGGVGSGTVFLVIMGTLGLLSVLIPALLIAIGQPSALREAGPVFGIPLGIFVIHFFFFPRRSWSVGRALLRALATFGILTTVYAACCILLYAVFIIVGTLGR